MGEGLRTTAGYRVLLWGSPWEAAHTPVGRALGQHSLDSMNNKRREDERVGTGREKGGWGRYEQYTSMKLSKSKIF